MPLLNGSGQSTGETIAGATTIKLTEEQSKLAAQASKLWIQGGTPTQPITDPVTYGFGALRCATDNLNGDNVEWISYPLLKPGPTCSASPTTSSPPPRAARSSSGRN